MLVAVGISFGLDRTLFVLEGAGAFSRKLIDQILASAMVLIVLGIRKR